MLTFPFVITFIEYIVKLFQIVSNISLMEIIPVKLLFGKIIPNILFPHSGIRMFILFIKLK